MRTFHISDVLSVTTGLLVSSRHMAGVYDILNFLTGDDLFTHQLPRASKECKPWLRTQFPQLFPENPLTANMIASFQEDIEKAADRGKTCRDWAEAVRVVHELPEMLPVYEMGEDMHLRIDPIAELQAMVGDEKVVVVVGGEDD